MNLWNSDWDLTDTFKSLSLTEKGIIVHFLSKIAVSDEFKINIPDNNSLSELGVTFEFFDSVLSKLKSIHPMPLMVRRSTQTGHKMLSSPYLNTISNNIKKKKENTINEVLKNNSPSHSLRARRNQELSVIFLPADKRKQESFTNWLPTLRFNNDGQVYIINEASIKNWKIQFSQINVIKELNSIFNFLMEDKNRRRAPAHINNLIINWLSKANEKDEGDNLTRMSKEMKIDSLFSRMSNKYSKEAV